jgi:hypothetical protein
VKSLKILYTNMVLSLPYAIIMLSDYQNSETASKLNMLLQSEGEVMEELMVGSNHGKNSGRLSGSFLIAATDGRNLIFNLSVDLK